jgi:hypothetical protein
MRVRAVLFVVSLIGSLAVERTWAAIPTPHAARKARARMVADAQAAQPAVGVVPAPGVTLEADPGDVLQRVIRERDNVVSARLDEIDARIYEVVGRLELLAACLIALLLGMFVWLASIARHVAQLAAEVRGVHSSGFG